MSFLSMHIFGLIPTAELYTFISFRIHTCVVFRTDTHREMGGTRRKFGFHLLTTRELKL